MLRILQHEGEAYVPENLLPEKALNWCRYLVGTKLMRLNSWRSKTKVTFWRTGEYAFYKLD